MTNLQVFFTMVAIMLGTMLTRFLPFLVFRPGKSVPRFVVYLGTVLPLSVIGLLVVYCLRGVSIFSGSHGLPELIALSALLISRKIKKNTLFSIFVGTVVYMICVQRIF